MGEFVAVGDIPYSIIGYSTMQSALAILHNAVYAEIANEPIGIWPGMALAMPVLLMGTMLNERKLIADFGDE